MQPTVTRLARPATSVLRLQARARSSPGHAFICSGCLQSRQQPLLPLSQNRPSQRRICQSSTLGASSIPKSLYSTATSSPTTQDQSTAPLTPPESLVTSGLAHLSRRLISVSGPDAAKYLQGVITANITNADGTPRTEPFYAAFLTAKGRVLHDVFLYPIKEDSKPAGESFLIEVDALEATRLQQHIKRYKLRAKFDVRLLDESEYQVWHAWNLNDSENLASACQTLREKNDVVFLTPDPRAPGLGIRIILQTAGGIETSSSPSLPPIVPKASYTLHRYSLGVPEGQSEILRDQALPLESNIDVMGGIDFRKGCYVGQELTIRTKHRGVVRKRILPVVVASASADSLSVGTGTGSDSVWGELKSAYQPTISSSSEEEALALPDAEARIGRKEKPDRRVGQWLSGVGNLGLALCRLEVMTDLQVPGETASAGYNPEKDEFVVSAGTGGVGAGEGEEAPAATEAPRLKVKAYVPEWLRAELEKPAH